MPLTDVSECSKDAGDGEISSFGALYTALSAAIYRVITKDGHSLGGPFYYIERGMGKTGNGCFAAASFSFALIISG